MHKSKRDGHFPVPCWMSIVGRENEVANHFELPLFEYLPETPHCRASSSSCWFVFLEQAPPIKQNPCNEYLPQNMKCRTSQSPLRCQTLNIIYIPADKEENHRAQSQPYSFKRQQNGINSGKLYELSPRTGQCTYKLLMLFGRNLAIAFTMRNNKLTI